MREISYSVIMMLCHHSPSKKGCDYFCKILTLNFFIYYSHFIYKFSD